MWKSRRSRVPTSQCRPQMMWMMLVVGMILVATEPRLLANADDLSTTALTPGLPLPSDGTNDPATQAHLDYSLTTIAEETTANASSEANTDMKIDDISDIQGNEDVDLNFIWRVLGYITVPSLLVIGILGNTMTIIIMRGGKFHQNPISYILVALSISDTTLNILSPYNKMFVIEMIGMDIRALSDVSCKVFFWFWRTSKMTSSWFVVLISVERLVAVVFPFRAAKLITKKYALWFIICIYIGIGSYNAGWGSVVDRVIFGTCLPNTRPEDAKTLSLILILIGCCLYSFLPCLLLVINTSCIVFFLHKSMKIRRQLSQGKDDTKQSTSMITGMLLGVCVAFVVLVLPITIGHLLAIIGEVSILGDSDLSISIFREVAQVMEQLNYSINFFLYVICSSAFRSEFFRIIGYGKDKEESKTSISSLRSSRKADAGDESSSTRREL